MLQPVSVGTKSLADYTHLAGRPLIQEIRELAEPLQGLRVLHLSATAFGGGVAEILYTLIPLMNDVGIDAQWEVMLGREEFYNVTKRLHNALQGNPDSLSDEEWKIFERYNALNATEVSGDWDVIIVHDPQPVAVRRHVPEKARTWIWRCHIDLSTPNPDAIEHIVPFVRDYDASVWHVPAYVPPSLERRRRGREHLPAGDRPAVAQEHGALPRGRRVRVRPVRHRRGPAAALPGVALRPLEGPDGRDRRLPHREGGDAGGAAGAGGLDGDGRPRGLGVLQLDDGLRRRRPGHPHPQQPQQRRGDRGQRVPVAGRRGDPEVHARGLRADGVRGALEGRARSSAATSAASRCRCRTARPGSWSPRPPSAPTARCGSCASPTSASSSAGPARSTCASTSSRRACCATGCRIFQAQR